jgi:hypothetical protein
VDKPADVVLYPLRLERPDPFQDPGEHLHQEQGAGHERREEK